MDLSREFQVYAVSRNAIKSPNENVVSLPIDLSSDWATDKLPLGLHAVIHLAQSDKFKDFPDSAMDVFNVNLNSTAKLLDFAHTSNVTKFVLASTGGIYRRGKAPLSSDSELEAPTQLTQYFGTKLAAEIFANNYKEIFDVDILRLFFMYGPRQKPHMFIPRLITSIKSGTPITLAGNDGIRVNPIYVDDVSRLVNGRVSALGSEVVNVCGVETVSIRQIAEEIGNQLGIPPLFTIVKEEDDLIADSSRAAELLSNSFTSLHTGLHNLISN
jgi:nucleoside-diphosphate-sugar epimerase